MAVAVHREKRLKVLVDGRIRHTRCICTAGAQFHGYDIMAGQVMKPFVVDGRVMYYPLRNSTASTSIAPFKTCRIVTRSATTR